MITSASDDGASSVGCPVLRRFLFPFLFGDPSAGLVSEKSILAQMRAETRAESRVCSAVAFSVSVSYTRRRCLSTASDMNANKFALGENEERAAREEMSSTIG